MTNQGIPHFKEKGEVLNDKLIKNFYSQAMIYALKSKCFLLQLEPL